MSQKAPVLPHLDDRTTRACDAAADAEHMSTSLKPQGKGLSIVSVMGNDRPLQLNAGQCDAGSMILSTRISSLQSTRTVSSKSWHLLVTNALPDGAFWYLALHQNKASPNQVMSNGPIDKDKLEHFLAFRAMGDYTIPADSHTTNVAPI